MSKLNVDQKTISQLLSDKKTDFLIPDYQRPYAWDQEQCQTLWDDIYQFSFPDNNSDNFDENEEYFLGSIVTYKNEKGKLEVIDGQQRLTTILLLLRAFYDKFANMLDKKSVLTRDSIEKCIWKTDTFGTADKNILKINSEVATDNDKDEFLDLLRTGDVKKDAKSQYVSNYLFFKSKINDFLHDSPSIFAYLPARILNNCILLPIEAESQDTALRIFSTLNDRGLPLSDADIFKAQLYKYHTAQNKKDEFISEWKTLEEITSTIFKSSSAHPMDELFARFMYYLRAKEGNKNSTTEALRKFYERKKYEYLKQANTISDLNHLANFWKSILTQDKSRFSEAILKKLFVLNYAPNSMWQNITSVYFLHNKQDNLLLEENSFKKFLNKITAFILTYSITNPGVNALRTPIYDEMVTIVNGEDVTFAKYKFNKNQARTSFDNYIFANQRSITRSIITWYAYTFPNQQLIDIKEIFHLEHIYSRKRQEIEAGLKEERNLESLGNKVLLESSINIKASDYHFEDKIKYYTGELPKNSEKKPSKIAELSEVAKTKIFDEQKIIDRKDKILDCFFNYLEREDMVTQS